MSDDRQLLREYATGSEAAFRQLVERHINLVYSAALRYLHDAHLAEDVAQTVFTALARKAGALPNDLVLGGWLYRHTCFVAAQALRTERRRLARETRAVEMKDLDQHPEPDWEQLSPHLDEAMEQLRAGDRDALVLRFFEGRNLQNVGATLGVSEEAARKRITRAIEKLRTFFVGRGVTLSAATLSTLLATNAAPAAPVGVALVVSSGALAAAAQVTAFTFPILKLISMTKLQLGIVGAVVVASVVTPLVLHQQSRAKQQAAEAASQRRVADLANAQAETDRLNGQMANASGSPSQSNDLLRLRTAAASLNKQTNNLPALQKENRRLRAATDKPDSEPTPEQKEEIMAKMDYGKSRFMASARFARTNQGIFPTSFSDVAGYFPEGSQTDLKNETFEILYQGTFRGLGAISNAQNVIVVRQKEPVAYGNRWAKVYGYGDGHFEVHSQADSDFAAWESQRVFTPVAVENHSSRMTKLHLTIVSAAVIASTFACWTIQRSAQRQWQQQNEITHLQSQRLAAQIAENERLSNLLARTQGSDPLAGKQLQALLRLRNQVGQHQRIRTAENDLRLTNQQLSAALGNRATNNSHWTGDQIVPAGYAEPENAMKSTLSAWLTSDFGAYLASCSPEDQIAVAKEWEGKSEAEFSARHAAMARLYAPAKSGVRVMSQSTVAPGEAVVDLYFEGDGKSRQFTLKKFGDEWKVTGLVAIFD